ncbi:sulfotransferase family protein [Cochleicola gelatinilyticus]|uniref:Sulfotransferase domain-containing protein n=1 Tax=Cochleicola gelatinilyticus TaxID=1763537 RepID=A0A167EPW4_9FLAO|nr:sulfotransferase family protein [Cochleicola gelatinilyticus]OAB75757.1 hypothetical protein ULVI_14880 [Cochleicola gelatinilyticus]
MLFPELARGEIDSMKVSSYWVKGIFRRVFQKRKKKVFVIGFHKTGTSSMGHALQELGYRVCGSLKEGKYLANSDTSFLTHLFQKAQPLLKKYDAFQDTPWFLMYEELYNKYPDAYFILTVRDAKSWLKSYQKHFKTDGYLYHDEIYGTLDSINEAAIFIKRYEAHVANVRDFFSSKGKLLEFRTGHDEWRKLTDFLNVKTPNTVFPHSNKAQHSIWMRSFKKSLKRLYYRS